VSSTSAPNVRAGRRRGQGARQRPNEGVDDGDEQLGLSGPWPSGGITDLLVNPELGVLASDVKPDRGLHVGGNPGHRAAQAVHLQPDPQLIQLSPR
jgi:hypothetical protein